MFIGLQLFISLVVGLSILAFILGMRALFVPADQVDRMQQVIGIGNLNEPITLQQLEMRASFFQRVIVPLLTGALQRLSRLAPKSNLEQLQQRLETAGFPGNLTVIDFLGLKILMGITLSIFAVGATYLVRPELSFSMLALLAAIFAFFGFMLPNIWLSGRVRSRKTEIRKSLPDALDMLTICVGAGVGLSGAMQHVTEAWDNALCEEFARVLTEVKLGRSRIESMESMARRTDVDEVKSFVNALVLADKLGVSISQTLRIQAEQMRVARRQIAEESAREASIKMLFPLVFLIFPAMFAVLLGPAIPLLLETLTGF
jgi:tight adherence protein C